MAPTREVAQLLFDWSKGDKCALDELFRILLGELRRRAHNARRHERSRNSTLETTALIHETYLKLARYRRPPCKEREHFFAMASQAMRRVLVEHARRVHRAKRAGIRIQLDLVPDAAMRTKVHTVAILALNEALEALAAIDPQKVQIAEMKLFAGLTNQEIANELNTPLNRVTRDWQFARAFLAREISRSQYDS
jgi:RNA polymerase sigma factor (TIGR02999 family)